MREIHQVSAHTLREVMAVHRQEIERLENWLESNEQEHELAITEMEAGWNKCKNDLNRELKRNEQLEEEAEKAKTLGKKVTAYEQRLAKVKHVISEELAPELGSLGDGNLPGWYINLLDAVSGPAQNNEDEEVAE